MYMDLSPELDVMLPDGLNLLMTDLPVMIKVLNDTVMEEEETLSLTLTEMNFNQEQGKYFISILNIVIAAEQSESSRAYIHIHTLTYIGRNKNYIMPWVELPAKCYYRLRNQDWKQRLSCEPPALRRKYPPTCLLHDQSRTYTCRLKQEKAIKGTSVGRQ